jgi:hypothetical protein
LALPPLLHNSQKDPLQMLPPLTEQIFWTSSRHLLVKIF